MLHCELLGITSQPYRFGGTEYNVGRPEIGHVHGDSLVDIPFPKKAAMSWSRRVGPNATTSFPTMAGSVFFCGKRLMWTEQSSSFAFHLRSPIKELRDHARRWAVDRPVSPHFLLLAVAFLMSGVAVLASASDSNPSTAENLRPMA